MKFLNCLGLSFLIFSTVALVLALLLGLAHVMVYIERTYGTTASLCAYSVFALVCLAGVIYVNE